MKDPNKIKAKKLFVKQKNDKEANDIVAGADALLTSQDKFSDAALDKENDRRFILAYEQRNPKPVFISRNLRPYLKKFPLEFYRQIYRLHGWSTEGKRLHNRPQIIGTWTNEIIYLRYPGGLLKKLQQLNPLTDDGTRPYKHFQWLNELGEEHLVGFINDAIRVMQQARYWDQFKRLFAKEFGAEYQLDLFDKN